MVKNSCFDYMHSIEDCIASSLRLKMPVRGVVFRLSSSLPPEAESLLRDFRLAVNEAVRAGISTGT